MPLPCMLKASNIRITSMYIRVQMHLISVLNACQLSVTRMLKNIVSAVENALGMHLSTTWNE